MTDKTLFKVAFHSNGKVYELFAKAVDASLLPGFVVVSELVFEARGSIVLDPAEEKLRDEFADVTNLHLPMHTIIRIEEVSRRGTARIRDSKTGENITNFPGTYHKT